MVRWLPRKGSLIVAGGEASLATLLAWWGIDNHSILAVVVLVSIWCLIIVKALSDRESEKESETRSKRQDAWLDERESRKRFRRRLCLDAASLARELDVMVRRFSRKLHVATELKWQGADATIQVLQAWENYYDNEVFRRLARIHARSKTLNVAEKDIDDALFEGVDIGRARIVERALDRIMTRLDAVEGE